ncbi:MAG: hypothetical protein OCC49_16030 [Fibrobacterales bacterium]
MSSLQTAKTLDPGKGRLIAGGGYYTSPEINEIVDSLTTSEELAFPYLEIAYRRGIVENFDMGLKLTLIGTMFLDGKYQLIDSESYAIATGAGVGYVSIESGSGDFKTKTDIYDIQVPVYASYHLGDYVAVYATPKYNLRIFGGDGSGASSMVGSTAGLKIGKDAGIFVEATYMTDVSDDFSLMQFNGSVFF